MINDHYLIFPDAGTASAVLSEAFGADDDGFAIEQSETHFAVQVGIIKKFQEDGSLLALPGYHVNLRLLDRDLPTSLSSFVIKAPASPEVVFA